MKKPLGFMFLAISLLFSTATAHAAVNTDLDSYVLFATGEGQNDASAILSFKGGNTAGTGYVLGGNVGANRVDGLTNNGTSMIAVGVNGDFIMSPGTQLVGDTIRLGPEAVVYDVYRRDTVPDGELGVGWGTPGVVNGTKYSFSAPIFNPMPSLFDPTFTAGSLDITVTKGGLYDGTTLAPGAYGVLNVQDGATIHLTAGTYTFSRFRTGQGFTVYTAPGTIIQVAGDGLNNGADLQFNGNGSYVGSAVAGVESVALFRYLGTDVQFSDSSTFYGVILAPDASIGLGRAMDLYGRFVGAEIHSDFNDNIWYRNFTPVPIPSTMLLLGSGLAGLVGIGRWGRRRNTSDCIPKKGGSI